MASPNPTPDTGSILEFETPTEILEFSIKGTTPTRAEREKIRRKLINAGVSASKAKLAVQAASTPEAQPEQLPPVPPPPGMARRALGALTPRTVGDVTPGLEMGGAMGGIAFGAPLGPAGAAAGGVLGAGAGRLAANVLEAGGRAAGAIGPEGPIAPTRGLGIDEGPLGPTRDALNAMAFEAVIPQVAARVRPFLQGVKQRLALGETLRPLSDFMSRRPVIGALFADSDDLARGVQRAQQARQEAALLAEQGIEGSIEDVSPRTALTGFRTVAGRFPFLSGIFNEASSRRGIQGADAATKQLLELAPLVDRGVMGSVLTNTARRATRAMRRDFSALYQSVYDAASEAGARVPTDRIRAGAADVLQEAAATKPRMRVLDPETGEVVLREIPDQVANRVRRFAKVIQNLEPDLSIEQFMRLKRDLRSVIAFSKQNGFEFHGGMELHRALDQATEDVTDPVTRAAFRKANRAFQQWSRLTESSTARQFVRSRVNLFEPGFETAGSRPVDELFPFVFRSNSAQSMRELRSLLGKGPEGERAFRMALQTQIDEIMDQTLRKTGPDQVLDFNTLRTQLGLTGRRSPRRRTMETAFRLAGRPDQMRNIERFVDALEIAARRDPVNVSQFVARRAVLGGPGSLVRSFAPARAAVRSGTDDTTNQRIVRAVIAPIAVMTGARRFSRFLTDPQALRAATRAIDDRGSLTLRRANGIRFLELMARDAAASGERELIDSINEGRLELERLRKRRQQKDSV